MQGLKKTRRGEKQKNRPFFPKRGTEESRIPIHLEKGVVSAYIRPQGGPAHREKRPVLRPLGEGRGQRLALARGVPL